MCVHLHKQIPEKIVTNTNKSSFKGRISSDLYFLLDNFSFVFSFDERVLNSYLK